MRHAYLDMTYRKGRPLAADYYLPRQGTERSIRTEPAEGGLLVDYAADGRAIGVEIPSPADFNTSALNRLLERLGQQPAAPEDLAPLVAA